MKYEKIVKWVLAVLFVVGIVVSVYGFIKGWPTKENGYDPTFDPSVEVILWGAYAFAGITILALAFGVLVIGGLNNPKSLIKILVGLVVIAALVGGAWVLAPGTLPDGWIGESKTDFELRLTDASLTLTYILCGATLLSLVAGWIIGATRK